MKRWCPLAQTDCEDGYTKESECQCVFWDSFNGSCVQASWLFMAHDKISGQGREQLLSMRSDEDDANL